MFEFDNFMFQIDNFQFALRLFDGPFVASDGVFVGGSEQPSMCGANGSNEAIFNGILNDQFLPIIFVDDHLNNS